MTPRRVFRALLQLALLAIVVVYVYRHRSDYVQVFRDTTPDWGGVTQASVLVLVAYVVLIQTWRQTVNAWGERLDLLSATRIWFVSNLGKYLPGKVWAIAAMGTLAQEEGVSATAAIGSSLVVQLVNIVTGFAVAILAGARALEFPAAVYVAAAIALVAIATAPWLLPPAARLASDLSGKTFAEPRLPPSAIWWAAAGTTLAWIFYGIAFEALAFALAPSDVHGTIPAWTAVFVGTYLLGFVAVFSPGGLGVREMSLGEALPRAGLAFGSTAALLVVASRVWLTVLEIVPGVLFMLIAPPQRADSPRR